MPKFGNVNGEVQKTKDQLYHCISNQKNNFKQFSKEKILKSLSILEIFILSELRPKT
jgi:hypothetical protein